MGGDVSEDVQRSLGRIEGALRVIQEGIADMSRQNQNHATDDTKRFADHDVRISKAERKISYFGGGIAVIVAFFEYLRH